MSNNKECNWIELSRLYFATIDRSDFGMIVRHSWHVIESSSGIYAVTNIGKYPNRRKVYMHRMILDVFDKRQVHHKNGNTLDNRRENLEVCSQQVNLSYRKKRGD